MEKPVEYAVSYGRTRLPQAISERWGLRPGNDSIVQADLGKGVLVTTPGMELRYVNASYPSSGINRLARVLSQKSASRELIRPHAAHVRLFREYPLGVNRLFTLELTARDRWNVEGRDVQVVDLEEGVLVTPVGTSRRTVRETVPVRFLKRPELRNERERQDRIFYIFMSMAYYSWIRELARERRRTGQTAEAVLGDPNPDITATTLTKRLKTSIIEDIARATS
jgi:hypothetical protein